MMLAKIRIRDRGDAVPHTLADGMSVAEGAQVILEDGRGLTFGVVYGAPFPASAAACRCQRPREGVLRLASQAERQQIAKLLQRESEAFLFCAQRAGELGLNMKVFHMEGVLTDSNLTCFFTAEQRVDFRQLVKDLGRRFHCHVLMQQISPREEARRVGGCGPCGRSLCCASFLAKPQMVTSRGARQAAPGVCHSKLTGNCGKLMCCLNFESADEAVEPVSARS